MTLNEGSGETLASTAPAPEPGVPRKPYESPALREWGSIRELTAGAQFDIQDGDFTGSGGT
jgi:hypothetical protein